MKATHLEISNGVVAELNKTKSPIMVRKPTTFQTVMGHFYIMTYKEQLRDPRWQRVQSQVRERDKYKCQLCGATDKFLHVHHLYYKPNTKVWEYDIESLTTLCESCHESVHSSLPKIISLAIFQIVKEKDCIFDIQQYLAEKVNVPLKDKELF